jgi:hypothetical protein
MARSGELEVGSGEFFATNARIKQIPILKFQIPNFGNKIFATQIFKI